MPVRLGQYEIRPSKVPRWLIHTADHFVYSIKHLDQKLPPQIASMIFGFIYCNTEDEKRFNQRHKQRFSSGSYEVFYKTT